MSKANGVDRLIAFFEVMSTELSDLPRQTAEKRFAVDRLASRMKKRAAVKTKGLDSVAISTFIENNDFVATRSLSVHPDIVANSRLFIENMLERYTTRLDPESVQMTMHFESVISNWRFGPGASNGVKGTHTAQKIGQKMTCTALSEPLVKRLRRANPYFYLFDEANNGGTAVVSGSKLTTVPKNEDTERTIAVEPSGNMALQLSAGRYLEGVLSMIGLPISSQQPKNKALACRGSVDNSLATIDLRSASDLIGRDLVALLMPRDWVVLLETLRSPDTTLPDGRVVDLNMVSTMGNGFTFPLMTLLIVALLYGFRCTRGGPTLYVDWTNTAVFGDDIIIPSTEYSGFCDVLHQAGFIVNSDKSYSDGPFRESCGGDFYKGYDVTPFYVRSLQQDADIYVALNQVLSWCGRHCIVLFRTVKYLMSLLNDGPYLVPEWMGPDQGILTSLCPRRYKYLRIRRVMLAYDGPFAMPLCVGGYVESHGPGLFYTPRVTNPRYCVSRARLPSGYLNGADPVSRSGPVTNWVAFIVQLVT